MKHKRAFEKFVPLLKGDSLESVCIDAHEHRVPAKASLIAYSSYQLSFLDGCHDNRRNRACVCSSVLHVTVVKSLFSSFLVHASLFASAPTPFDRVL